MQSGYGLKKKAEAPGRIVSGPYRAAIRVQMAHGPAVMA